MVKKKRQPRSEAAGKQGVSMSPELRELLLKQREAFVQKFGREPGLTEPVFFDPSADDPQPLDADEVTATLLKACEQGGLDPEQFFLISGGDRTSMRTGKRSSDPVRNRQPCLGRDGAVVPETHLRTPIPSILAGLSHLTTRLDC